MKAKAFSLIMILAAFIVSCQKSAPLEESSVESADDAVLAEAVFDDAFASLEIATVYAESAKKAASVIDTCPVVTATFPGAGLWPINIVVDYGTGCTGLNDVVRSGKILISLSDARVEMGSVRTLTFENYNINGAKVEGTLTVTNNGLNNNNNVVFSVVLTGGKITFPDDKFIEREYNRLREYTAGYLTWWNPWDDKCLITGTASGTNLNGVSYTVSVINPLEWQAVCRFLVSGTMRFEVEGVEPYELDYGSGECDAVATLTRGDDSKEIILRYRHPKYTIGK
ncbi:MAG: hypothetical protein WCD55_09575 [Bacteroidales bacterium]